MEREEFGESGKVDVVRTESRESRNKVKALFWIAATRL